MTHNGPGAVAGPAAIVTALADAGTRVMFGLPGGGPNLDVVGAAAAAGLRFVLTHTETAAVIMAATYAELTGLPGAAVVTRGPGLASAVNGIAHAALDRLPVVVIADTVRSADAGRIRRDGPTVIDVQVDPASYPAIMDLSRGQAGRRPLPGLALPGLALPAATVRSIQCRLPWRSAARSSAHTRFGAQDPRDAGRQCRRGVDRRPDRGAGAPRRGL